MLGTLHDHAVVVVVDRLEVKSWSRALRVADRTATGETVAFTSIAHGPRGGSGWCPARSRWPGPSEGSAVLTGLRLGRGVRDARLPYLRF